MDYCIPRYRFHMASQQETQKEKPLTKKERRIIKALKAVSAKSVIGHCIHNTLAGKVTRTDLQQLISELKDQLRDAPENTRRFLGEELTELLNQH